MFYIRLMMLQLQYSNNSDCCNVFSNFSLIFQNISHVISLWYNFYLMYPSNYIPGANGIMESIVVFSPFFIPVLFRLFLLCRSSGRHYKLSSLVNRRKRKVYGWWVHFNGFSSLLHLSEIREWNKIYSFYY